MIDLSNMTYWELFKLNRVVEREMSFRAESWVAVIVVVAIVAVIIWASWSNR